ncbi:MAG: subtilisin family serine protease [Bacteriovoracaceae bacterium]|jgi:subtilisin family serine protease
MKAIVIILVTFYSTLSLAGHSLSEGKMMIKKGLVDTSSIVIKYRKLSAHKLFSFWDFKNVEGFSVNPLFENLVGDQKSNAAKDLKGFSEVKFRSALSKKDAVKVLEDLYSQENIEYAIFNPKVEEAGFFEGEAKDEVVINTDISPDFEHLQFHLDPAPIGVDARFAWDIPGGTGKGVRIIDMETGVNSDHEDFERFFFISDLPKGKVNHGTAVAGEMIAKRDGKGVTGISYEADFGFFSRLVDNDIRVRVRGCKDEDENCTEQEENPYHKGVAANLAKVVEQLGEGDLIVLEMHSPGPRGEYIPTEYWNPIYRILKYATEEKGIHCVAAAGNGSEDLDHKDYNRAFDTKYRDSGCVLVGASLSDIEDRHRRASFSNYGSRVDAFGYGRGVVTAGYGDLHRGLNANYTDTFSGTSSATPIVGGAMVSLLGMAKSLGVSLSPKKLRAILRSTGTPQVEPNGQRIGNLPDIKAAHRVLFKNN